VEHENWEVAGGSPGVGGALQNLGQNISADCSIWPTSDLRRLILFEGNVPTNSPATALVQIPLPESSMAQNGTLPCVLIPLLKRSFPISKSPLPPHSFPQFFPQKALS